MDAASGGFIAPFLYPELEWDFRLPLVKSINVSGHKYGLVYAGIGWVIWRTKDDLPEELIFHINYLGADQPTFTLNFSKGMNIYINIPSFIYTVSLTSERYDLTFYTALILQCRFQPNNCSVLSAYSFGLRGWCNFKLTI